MKSSVASKDSQTSSYHDAESMGVLVLPRSQIPHFSLVGHSEEAALQHVEGPPCVVEKMAEPVPSSPRVRPVVPSSPNPSSGCSSARPPPSLVAGSRSVKGPSGEAGIWERKQRASSTHVGRRSGSIAHATGDANTSAHANSKLPVTPTELWPSH